jgi:hypothetical protein
MDRAIKQHLYNHCLQYIDSRMANAQEALNSAQESANYETKSTAGDKHDTSRAMMQLEVERLSKQLSEVQKLKRILINIDPCDLHKTVQTGSVVETTAGNFYFAISAGKVDFNGGIYFTAAPSSPVFQIMKGLKEGDHYQMNNRKIEIKKII